MNSPRVLGKVLITVLMVFGVWRTNAASDYLLKISGIDGEHTTNGHTNEIAAVSFSLGITNSGGTPIFTNLKVTKILDKSSPLLVLNCAQGTLISNATLTLRDQTPTQVEYYKIILTNVIITSVTTSGNNSDPRPTETVTFTFQSIEWDYQQVDSTGNPVGSVIKAIYPGSPV